MRVFPAVDSCIARPELWAVENGRLEIVKFVRQLKLISSADDNARNDPPPPATDRGSPDPDADADAEEQRLQLLANANTCYNNMDALLRPVVLKYKIPTIPSMSEFITSLDFWLVVAHASVPCSVISPKKK